MHQTMLKFRVTYGNRGMSVAENELPRYPDEVMELRSTSNIGDLFHQLYLRNPTDPSHDWSLASPVDRLIYRYPCKNDLLLSDAFPSPQYYNEKGEIEILADQDHLITEAATIMKDYDFMITLIKKLPIPQATDQRKRVIGCLSKVVTGIINRIRYRPEIPQFCYSNCVHQVEFNKLRIYANSIADGSIFGLNLCKAHIHETPSIPSSPSSPSTPSFPSSNKRRLDDEYEEEENTRKKTKREQFPIEQLPEEIMAHILTFAGPKELCNFEQVSRDWEERVKSQSSLWGKFCNDWKLRNEEELPLGFKDVVKTVFEIQACRKFNNNSNKLLSATRG